MLFTMYFSGGSRAENSPVCGSVSMTMYFASSPVSVCAVLCMAVVSLAQVRLCVASVLNKNDSLLSFSVILAWPMLFFVAPKPTASVSARVPPATRPTKLTSVESAKS